MFEDNRQLESTVEDEVFEFSEYWFARKPRFIEAARSEFETAVDLAIYYMEHPTPEQIEVSNMAFTEWILFEWRYEQGKTMLELYLERCGDELDRDARSRLQEVLATQFFSRFKIADKDRASGLVTLVDVRDGKSYDVIDSEAVGIDRWSDGTLAERIACVEGAWVCVGRLHLYDVAPASDASSDGPGAVHPEDVAAGIDTGRFSFYLRLLRDVLGVDGRYSPSLRAVRNEGVQAEAPSADSPDEG